MTGKYLITTDGWFTAPDGKDYKAVWGNVSILGDTLLGVKTNMRSTNWYAKIGTEENHVIVAGCQIHYAVSCTNKPDTKGGEGWDLNTEKIGIHKTPNRIYIAQ